MAENELRDYYTDIDGQISALWDEVENGDITPEDFKFGMLNLLVTFALLAYISGSKRQVTNADKQKVRDRLVTQLNYLEKFQNDILAFEGILPRAWRWRARMYGNSITQVYWDGALASMPPEIPRPGDGSTMCLVNCRCRWNIVRLGGDSDFDLFWELGLSEHCPDCVERASRWRPLRVRGGIVYGL